MDAYSDPHGNTRRFNINLLVRLNRELDANFNINQFEQHTQYNPHSGEVQSFLISQKNQVVDVGQLEQTFQFGKLEPVFVERSRKYDQDTIFKLAAEHGFSIVSNYSDSCNYFVDSLWEKK